MSISPIGSAIAAPDPFDIPLPPTQAELPCDDGEPMETQRHKAQLDLLVDSLLPWLEARNDGYVGGNMFVYYSMAQVRNRDFKGPDCFVVLGVPKGERRSWVSWEEGKTPDVVIELLSDSTADADKGEKKQIYQTQLHVPEYFWFNPFDPIDWAGFRLQGGTYQAIALTAQNQMISEVLNLALVQWQGSYKGIETTWLRWANLDGGLLLTAEEQERQRAEQAEAQVQQIARNLMQTGMEVEQVAQVTGLAIAQLESLKP